MKTLDAVLSNDAMVAELTAIRSNIADFRTRVDAIAAVIRRAADDETAKTALIIALASEQRAARWLRRALSAFWSDVNAAASFAAHSRRSGTMSGPWTSRGLRTDRTGTSSETSETTCMKVGTCSP